MNRPEIRIIQDQQESISNNIDPNIPQYEIDRLLNKYGMQQSDIKQDFSLEVPKNNLTFEEMVAMQQMKDKQEMHQRHLENERRRNEPQSITFDSSNGKYYNTEWRDMDDINFGIKVQVVSDMPIDRYNQNK